MNGVLAKVIVGKTGRQYAARLGSRSGAIIRAVVAKQTESGGYDAQLAAWSSATIQQVNIVDGQIGQNVHSMALENKIAYQFDPNASGYSYSTRIGSRNGACISSIVAKLNVQADNQ